MAKDKLPVTRCMYNLGDFNDNEPGGGVSMTDPSEHVPTEEILQRFMRGEIRSRSTEQYDHEGNYMDHDNNDRIFREQEELRNDPTSLLGEEALAIEQRRLKQRIAEARLRKLEEKRQEQIRKDAKASEPKPQAHA